MLERTIALLVLASTALSSPVGLGAGRSNHTLDLRDNPVSCGWQNMYPCEAGQICYTSNNQAYCSTAGGQQAVGGGNYQMFTTTYTVSGALTTITSTYSSAVAGSTGGTCDASKGSHPCNPNLCCAFDQWCDQGLQCRSNGAAAGSPGGSPGLPAPTTMTISGTPTTISGFIAPTSVSITTITSSGTATTTRPFETPIGSSGAMLPGVTAQPQSGGGGLSAGAIAGIVIGVLVGLFILFIILACLCCKGIFDLLFGRNKKKETTTYIHTHHSAHGSSHSRPPPPRRWFGILPPKTDRPDRPEKSSGLGGIMAVGGALAALAVLLGLKRKNDRRRDDEKSDYTASNTYYSDSYYTDTSASSASSDRITRNTHRSHSRSRR